MMNQAKWLVAAAACLGMACGAQAQQTKGVAFARAEHLQRGVNLSSFYAQTRDMSQARLDAYMSVADMQALKAMGFDHVRLSINPALLIASPKTGTLRPAAMAQLDKTVGQLLDAGLNVILDIHAEEDWKAALTARGRRRGEFVRVLGTICRALCEERSGAGVLRDPE